MLFLHKGDQRFPNITTQRPQLVWISRTDQCPDLDRGFLGVSDHQRPYPMVPRRMRFNVSKKILPEFLQGQVIVEVEKYRPEKFGSAARPVFKRLLQEIADGNHQTPLVPQM